MSKKELQQIRIDYSLSADDIAVMCGVSESTARSWLYRKGHDIPDNLIKLLKFELSVKQENKK